MKVIFALIVVMSFFSCSNEVTESNEPILTEEENPIVDNSVDPIVTSNNTTETEEEISPGSTKFRLLGDWQADDDPDLMIRISPEKYCTFVNGQQNWDNPWDLCNYIDYAPENEDDNGTFVLVHLNDRSDVFYGQEIISLTENNLKVLIVKSSGGTGITQSFTRQ